MIYPTFFLQESEELFLFQAMNKYLEELSVKLYVHYSSMKETKNIILNPTVGKDIKCSFISK